MREALIIDHRLSICRIHIVANQHLTSDKGNLQLVYRRRYTKKSQKQMPKDKTVRQNFPAHFYLDQNKLSRQCLKQEYLAEPTSYEVTELNISTCCLQIFSLTVHKIK